MADVVLLVNGRRYGGWKRVRVTRSIETVAGSFALEVSDRWGGQDEPWAIAEEDECRVEIDGQVLIDGFVDRRDLSLTSDQRTLAYSGRDRAAVLVDSSALLQRWAFRQATVVDVARSVAAPFGVTIGVQPGLDIGAPLPKLVVHPGDSAWQAVERAALAAGVLVVSNGAGGVVITRAGTERAAALTAMNVLSATVQYDATARYHRYVVLTQVAGTDEASGGATRIRAEATDEGVRRAERVLVIRPEAGLSVDGARRRGDWEARIRAARAETVTVVVQGWQQPTGQLWPINALATVHVPAIGVDGEMLIAQVDHTLSDAGEVTLMRLVRPDAFTPEPRAVVAGSGRGTAWKELAGGAQ